MWRKRESAETREERQIKSEEKNERKKKEQEKKHQRRSGNRLKKQEKRIKTNSELKEDSAEILREILEDNPVLKQKKIICFDLYWTLIYRPHSHWKTKHFLKKFKIELFKKFYEIVQTNKKENVKAAYDSLEGFKMPNRALRALQKHTDEEVKNTKIYPETLAVLKKLKNCWYKLALISNLSQDFEVPLRKLIPNDIFDYEALSYDVWVMKPDEAIFKKILNDTKDWDKNTEYIMSDMLMIWDSKKSDVDWAKKVWMDAILLSRKTEKANKSEKTKWQIEKISYDREKNLITIHTLADLFDILWINY